jgi:hypothetical protein
MIFPSADVEQYHDMPDDFPSNPPTETQENRKIPGPNIYTKKIAEGLALLCVERIAFKVTKPWMSLR